MIHRIISGGQTGADQGGLDFALSCGLDCGGMCPHGRRSEAGPIPSHYPLTEHASWKYPPRTEANVKNSDATLIFAWKPESTGTALTERLCWAFDKPFKTIHTKDPEQAAIEAREFLRQLPDHATLNIAGNRESQGLGLCKFVVSALERCRDLFET